MTFLIVDHVDRQKGQMGTITIIEQFVFVQTKYESKGLHSGVGCYGFTQVWESP